MKKAIAIVCICVFSFCLFANQTVKAQPASTADQGASEYLLTIAQYDKAIADKKVPWETEEEYMARIEKDSEAIQLTNQMNAYKKEFAKEEYHIGFDKTVVKVLPFDAENKQFSIEITSRDDLLPFRATLVYKIPATDFEAIGREYSRIDTAYKANALVASIGYTVTEKLPNFWEIAFTSLSLYSQLESDNETQGLIKNYTSNEIKRTDEDRLVKLQKGTFIPLYAVIPITTVYPKDASILVGNRIIGTGSAVHEVPNSTRSMSITVQSKTRVAEKISIDVTRGINPLVEIELSRVGEIGPAGGYIFYDKGSSSDGWRYFEAAPARWSGSQEDPRYVFGYYRPSGSIKGVGTSTAIGSGKTNTAALVKAMGNQAYSSSGGSDKAAYAAKVASDYTVKVDGVTYNDWFLPSSDELNLMYTNLSKKNLGGFSGGYWSSSESGDNYAWIQFFDYGDRRNGSRDYVGRVRPVRAF